MKKKHIPHTEIPGIYKKDANLFNIYKTIQSLNLPDKQSKLCEVIIDRIEKYSNDINNSLDKNPLIFDYLSELNNISKTKYEIAVEIRNNVL